MKISILSILIFLMPLWGIAQELETESGLRLVIGKKLEINQDIREVKVYIESPSSYRKESQLSIWFEDHTPQSILVEADKHLYTFILPYSENDNRLFVRSFAKTTELVVDTEPNTVYLSIKKPHVFLQDIDLWTEEQIIEEGNPLKVRIIGEIPIGQAEEISVEIPFQAWPNSSSSVSSQLLPGRDWRVNEFNISLNLASSSLVFLHVNDQYFPIVIREDRDRRKYFSLVEEEGSLVIKKARREYLGQTFLNEKYGMNGMNEETYTAFVEGILSPDGRKETLLQLQKDMLSFTDRNRGFEDLVEILLEIDNDPIQNAFIHTLEEERKKVARSLWQARSNFQDIFYSTLLLSLIDFCSLDNCPHHQTQFLLKSAFFENRISSSSYDLGHVFF